MCDQLEENPCMRAEPYAIMHPSALLMIRQAGCCWGLFDARVTEDRYSSCAEGALAVGDPSRAQRAIPHRESKAATGAPTYWPLISLAMSSTSRTAQKRDRPDRRQTKPSVLAEKNKHGSERPPLHDANARRPGVVGKLRAGSRKRKEPDGGSLG